MYPTDSIFSIPLAWEAHDLAKQNHQKTSTHQAKQVYLRTLAMYAVKYYLDCMSIEAEYEDRISSHALFELSHAAEVYLPGLGSLECLPILSEASVVEVPPEVWSDRIAYIAVQLDESLQTAKIIGYVKTVATEHVPLQQFQQNSLEDLLIYLDQLRHPQIQQASQQIPTQLSQWFQNIFQQDWQNLNTLLTPAKLAYRNHRLSSAMGLKVFDLHRADEQVEVSLGLTPLDTSELDVWVGVYPTGTQTHLPADLQLVILNEMGDPVIQAQAMSTENIQLQFSGEPGEHFSVRLMLGDISVTEPFVI
ncbi:DUF1822 family protein [Leptolyngbyaceae cyanobacterium UHCC 1019]